MPSISSVWIWSKQSRCTIKRIGQILTVLGTIVDQQHRLDDALVDLAEAQKGLVATQAETGKRIQGLVSEIGEFIRRQP